MKHNVAITCVSQAGRKRQCGAISRVVVFLPLLIFIVLGILFWRGLQLDPSELPSALLNKPVPNFSLPSLQGEQVITQADLHGPALLNVWATWCPTCKQEHAQLNRIAREENVRIYGLNYKDDRAAAQAWLQRYLNPYVLTIFDQEGSLGLDLGVYGAPETYVIDGQGVIRYKFVGEVDEPAWQQLRQVLAQVAKEPAL